MCEAENIATESIEQSVVFPRAAEGLLKNGQTIRFTAAGNSMHPTIRQGDTLIVAPCNPTSLAVGDIVLFKDTGRLFAHRIIDIEIHEGKENLICRDNSNQASRAESPLLESLPRLDDLRKKCSLSEQNAGAPKVPRSTKHKGPCFVLRGDFRRNTDPPITASQILGKVVAVERNHKARSPYGCGKQFFAATYRISCHLKSFLSFGQ